MSPQHLDIETQQYGDTAFLRLTGEFDLAGESDFNQKADALLIEARTLVVDLSGLTFIDSSGLRALLQLREQMLTDGLDLAIVPGAAQVRATMEVTGVDRVLPLVAEADGHPSADGRASADGQASAV